MRLFIGFWLAIACLLMANSSHGQIFASVTEGCAPLASVQFSSSYPNATNISWDFGNGASSNLPEPAATYVNAGVYTVTFSATVDGASVSESLIITVFENPIADFSVSPSEFCLGSEVQFTDESEGGDNTDIVEWNWDYGNGTTGNFGPNPSFTYTNTGVYQVTLTVTDQNGCVTTATQNGAVAISQPPNLNIVTNPSPVVACEAPLTVSFTNLSTSNSPTDNSLAFDWDFGNGETSDQEDPTPVTYDSEGTYTITVTATDNIGCISSQNIPVSVQEPTAEISVEGAEDGVVCPNVSVIVEGTQGGFFNYGDGTITSDTSHVYGSAGEYIITYNVSADGCSAQASTTINVEIPTADIISDPGFSCEKPVTFSYSLESDFDLVEWNWNIPTFDLSSTEEEPSFEIDYDNSNDYSINGLRAWTVNVSYTSANGCQGSALFHVDSIALPNALIYPDVGQGCAPLDVTFDNESSYLFTENIVSYEWHFGDGTIISTGPDSQEESHTYEEAGEYEAFIILETAEGCIDTSFVHIIEVGEPVDPSFEVSPAAVCHGEPVQITNTSSQSELIEGYSYSGDLNTFSACYTDESPTMVFNDFAGEAEITQSVEYNGCISTSTQTVQVEGPVVKIDYGCNCETPFDYDFTATIFDADQWTWDFGDGNEIANSTQTLISHTYENTGDYLATITGFKDGGSCPEFTDTVLVKVRDLSAELSISENICAGVDITATAINTNDVADSDNCFRNYLWDFGDDTRPVKTLNSSAVHEFQNGGDFTVSLSVKDDNECVFTTTQDVSVYSLDAAYEADTLYGCIPLEVNFSDLSNADTSIVSWEWTFDDGFFSDQQNPNHVFNNVVFDANNDPIPFDITLVVTDAIGCVDEIDNLVIEPLAPNPAFTVGGQNQICEGEFVDLIPFGTNPNFHTYEWDFGNGNTSEESQPSPVYDEAGTYTVTLVVTDSIGCQREESQEIVFVQSFPVPLIGTNFDEDETLCYPFTASYSNQSINEAPLSVTWDVEQLGTITGQNTVGTTYFDPGFYDVFLEVSTTFGCVSDTAIVVEVEGPVGDINLNPSEICPGGSIELAISDTSDLEFWEFNFGDGFEESNQWPTTEHSYDPSFIPASGSTTISLVMYSADSACTSTRTETLVIEEVVADFSRNTETAVTDSIHCFGTPDAFLNQSSPNATGYNWTVPSIGLEETGFNLNTTLPPGEHVVQLIVTSDLGCADTLTKNMVIFPLPEAVASEGDAICLGESIVLTAEGGITFSWTPSSSLDDPNSSTVIATPNASTSYTVTVTDENNCSDQASTFVQVYQPPPSVSVDTTLRIGDTDIAGFNLGPGYTYQWSPDLELECDTCPTTLFRPLEDRTYTLTLSDTLGCFNVDSYFSFEILEVASIVLPDAFTPNGDGVNDILYVEGWGIEELLSFKIYNRWGELLFETNDLNEGWDGKYKGELQNPDSYAYVVEAKNFIFGNPETFTGFVDLVK